MATFKACVQKERKDGFYPVYIRVTHHRGTQRKNFPERKKSKTPTCFSIVPGG